MPIYYLRSVSHDRNAGRPESHIENQIANHVADCKSQVRSQIANHISQMALCVYAIATPPDGRITLRGIGRERLRAVTVGSIAAVVGELRRTPKPADAALRTYDRVLRALSQRWPALLPARFGTCVQDLIELTFILQSRQETLRRSLRAVRGRVQMTARVVQAPAATPGIPGGATSTIPGSGAHYLKARAAAAGREREILGFDPVRAAVRRWVRDEHVERRGSVVSVYHLVPRGQAQRYRVALERAAQDAGLHVVVSGPWPPYAFSTPF